MPFKETCQVSIFSRWTRLWCLNVLMAGYIFPPLSVKNMIPLNVLGVEPVSWSEELRKNGGEDVLCLPFSFSPFHLIEAVRSISLADANIGKVLRFEPSSLKNLMVCSVQRSKMNEALNGLSPRWRHTLSSCQYTSPNLT